ncbi:MULTISPECIES: hypothetical protein [Mycobacterium]|uniref:Uncharacterized protein n=1 Tax=Mycobacterium intracellulare subsp. chimaera TaxID=222805 RepID=A0ABT7NUC4_MYCIT|nr:MULTISPECIES: hypothetical protein [Mycobacterium]MCF1813867.1 hypothetical protein [Mycobacterium intracellulare subsp. intracellulare]MDM3924428.1 hypothetical protein [Mycobacterium intracellulare subsp. chimaera]MDS0335654.1 hypothetical protein [Mycobacterium intracellulare]
MPSRVAVLRCSRSLITGINATKWLATHPVASSNASTLTNRARVAARPLRARRLRPLRTLDEITGLLPLQRAADDRRTRRHPGGYSRGRDRAAAAGADFAV